MRASDLIGRQVLNAAGHRVGVVSDVRCVRTGRYDDGSISLRVDALVVAPRRFGAVLGYDRPEQTGPWLVRVLVRRLLRGTVAVPWSAVAAVAPDGITLS